MLQLTVYTILIILYILPMLHIWTSRMLLWNSGKSEDPISVDIVCVIFSIIPLLNIMSLFFYTSSYRYKLMSTRNDVIKCVRCNIYTRRYYLINKYPVWVDNKWSIGEYKNITSEAKCPYCNSNHLLEIDNLDVIDLPFGEKVPYIKALSNDLFRFKSTDYKLSKLEKDRITAQNTLDLIQQQSEYMDKLLKREVK